MGPGEYEFGDYWQMGLLLELIIVIAAIPLLIFFLAAGLVDSPAADLQFKLKGCVNLEG